MLLLQTVPVAGDQKTRAGLSVCKQIFSKMFWSKWKQIDEYNVRNSKNTKAARLTKQVATLTSEWNS